MNFYPFHLGDYISRTQHLSLLEDLAYRRMIDRYYLTEEELPLCTEQISRVIGMRDHTEIVNQIVCEFFVKTETGYRHERCDEEIKRYRHKADRARGLADKRWHGSDSVVKSDTITHTKSHTKPHTKSYTKSSATITNTNTNNSLPPNAEGAEEDEVELGDIRDEFTEFLAEYPPNRVKNLYRLQQAWSASRLTRPPTNELIEALRSQKRSLDWTKENGKFIPSPENWLLERRWQDKLDPAPIRKVTISKPAIAVDEQAAFLWRKENYPDSVQFYPTADEYPFKDWPQDVQREYLNQRKAA
jgi:uncharacterized protein YdaU (DUF1376 family)